MHRSDGDLVSVRLWYILLVWAQNLDKIAFGMLRLRSVFRNWWRRLFFARRQRWKKPPRSRGLSRFSGTPIGEAPGGGVLVTAEGAYRVPW